jgi:methylthioribose-1-phosphate isomerase
MTRASAAEIPIEIRSADEVRFFNGQLAAPANATVYNPSFDTTPASLVFAHISDQGVIYSPNSAKIRAAFGIRKH